MMQACSINSMPAERFMRDMFVVRGTNCKYGLCRFALICFRMCGVSMNFPPGARQPPHSNCKIAQTSREGLRIRAYWIPFVLFRDVSGDWGVSDGVGRIRTRDDMRHHETPQASSSTPMVSMGDYGSHPVKIAIPGDGPHLQKSIVDKFRCGSLWVRWGLFWASVSAGPAGWVLGKINLNE
jgi:hypothetical protein